VRRLLTTALAGVLCLGALAACDRSGSGRSPAADAPVSSDWPLPKDMVAAADQAGLEMLDREMLDVHYHAHLDVVARGVEVTVPAGIGIAPAQGLISPLHTHDKSGIIHIESAKDIPFRLGQLFQEWGQPLNSTRFGPLNVTADEELRLYVNGKRAKGDPREHRFRQHEQLVVWLGPADASPDVPDSFEFPAGL
jgi:hypothetical protein